MTLDVDLEQRTIRGLAVPYGVIAISDGRRYRFARGTITWADPTCIRVLSEHTYATDLGRAVEIVEDHEGLWPLLRIRRGPAGDLALHRAIDGTTVGLSIGLPPATVFAAHGGVLDCVAAVLVEVSLTPHPVFTTGR